MTIAQALSIAVQRHQAGQLDAAEQIYRQILQVSPEHSETTHLLGMIAHQVGRHETAAGLIERAIALGGGVAEQYNNLAQIYHAMGRFPEAVTCYLRALELKPGLAEAHNNLGNTYKEQGKLDDAIASSRRALELRPDFAEAHNNLGNAYKEQAKLGEAAASYRRAIEQKPGLAEAHSNLGLVYREQAKLDEAAACCRHALKLRPDSARMYSNLGLVLKEQGKLDEATAACQRALALEPNLAETHNNLGNVYKEQARLNDAVACYRRAIELKPEFAGAHSNLVYAHLFIPHCDAQTLRDEHRRWSQLHAARLEASTLPYSNERSPDRRLRIGYVSPSFRNHVVGRNLLPLFREHDHRSFEIACYSDSSQPDSLTARFRDCADAWRDTAGLGDARLSELIREDGIDLLVDLTLHLAHNRLPVFARRPAPVQATFAGYPGTTGLSAIQYRLTDPYLDPPGLHDAQYSEESIRLPDSFWCYDPLEAELAVNALPAVQNGCITFGCLNNFCKINPRMLALWARILRLVERSRLIMLAGEGAHRGETLALLAAHGVEPERVSFVALQSRLEYLRYYHRIDIGLDTVPYNGHTTSLDSLWMGAPVVTLVGATVVGRAGFSQLTNLGLPELIAFDPDHYVQIATGLAGDLPRLGRLRAELRDRMQASPLMDAPRFTRGIEAAYRQMWQRWVRT